MMGRTHPLSARRVILPAMALILAGGCVPMMIAEMVLDSETSVSLTVSGSDAELDFLLNQLTGGFDVQSTVKTVQTGVRVVEVVGTYLEVLETLNWMIAQGLKLVANDAITESILVALLK